MRTDNPQPECLEDGNQLNTHTTVTSIIENNSLQSQLDWAFHQRIPSDQKVVLLALCGRKSISLVTISSKSRKPPMGAKHILERLQNLGLIKFQIVNLQVEAELRTCVYV